MAAFQTLLCRFTGILRNWLYATEQERVLAWVRRWFNVDMEMGISRTGISNHCSLGLYAMGIPRYHHMKKTIVGVLMTAVVAIIVITILTLWPGHDFILGWIGGVLATSLTHYFKLDQ
jgi:hypothetical protein